MRKTVKKYRNLQKKYRNVQADGRRRAGGRSPHGSWNVSNPHKSWKEETLR